jgi:hypothetical protein
MALNMVHNRTVAFFGSAFRISPVIKSYPGALRGLNCGNMKRFDR